MLVILIWPRNRHAVLSDELSCCEPLPLEYLAGALRPSHEVLIHDMRLDGSLEGMAVSRAPGLIGIAVPYTTAIRGALEVAREAKRIWPETPLVVGGHHPSVSTRWMHEFPADYAIVGEGGAAIRYLVDSLERGGSFDCVPGLAPFQHYLSGISRPRIESLDGQALPDRSVTHLHRDRYFHSIYNPVALIRFSAGCPYQCSFCILWRLTDQRYLTKQADRIVNELEQVQVGNVYVVDDEAFINPRRMIEVAEAIERAGIHKKYHMYVRADTAVRNAAAIERWAKLGLDSVLVGAESMEEKDLLDYRKAAKTSDTLRAIRMFHQLGIKVRANFIVRPGYTDRDFDRLAATVQDLEVDLPTFAVLTPLPGTVLYEEVADQLISDNPDLFDCYHTLLPTNLPLDRFYDRLAGLLLAASCRISDDNPADPRVFYFSNNKAFERMVREVRLGYRLHLAPTTTSTPREAITQSCNH